MSNCCNQRLWVDREELQREPSMSGDLYAFWEGGRSGGGVGGLVQKENHVV